MPCHNHGRKFKTAKAQFSLKQGKDLAQAIASVRDAISEAEAERDRVRTAPLPAEERKAGIRAKIEAMAVSPAVTGAGMHIDIDLMPPLPLQAPALSRRAVSSLMAWLHGDAIIAKLEAEIDAATDPKQAISSSEKPGLDDEISARILDLERQEEALIERAEAASLEILRRVDASPEAVLGITAITEEINIGCL